MKRISIWAVGVIVVVVSVAVVWSQRFAPVREGTVAPVVANLQTKVFKVDQMTCATCPITVRTAMKAVTGVTSVTVDFDAKTATVTFDPTVATVSKIAEASTNAGYPATPLG